MYKGPEVRLPDGPRRTPRVPAPRAEGSHGRHLSWSEKGEVLRRGVGTLRCALMLSENSACQVPICAVAA